MPLSELGIAQNRIQTTPKFLLVAWLCRIMPPEDHQLWSKDGICFTITAHVVFAYNFL